MLSGFYYHVSSADEIIECNGNFLAHCGAHSLSQLLLEGTADSTWRAIAAWRRLFASE